MKGDWLYSCLVRMPRLELPEPYCVGPIEFTRRKEHSAVREQLLESSASRVPIDDLDSRSYYRARTFLVECTRHDAVRRGAMHVREAVEALPSLVPAPIPRPVVYQAGFVESFETGASSLLDPYPTDENQWGMGTTIIIDTQGFRDVLLTNYALIGSHSSMGDLGLAYRRSLHWRAVAREAHEEADELLLLWLAAEAMCHGPKEDGGLTAKFVTALVYPRGKCWKQLGAEERTAFSSDDSLRKWNKILARVFEELREARNNIAHQGYRSAELDELFSFDVRVVLKAMHLLVPRLQALCIDAIGIGITNVDELWDRIGEVFLANKTAGDTPITRDAHHCVSLLEKELQKTA